MSFNRLMMFSIVVLLAGTTLLSALAAAAYPGANAAFPASPDGGSGSVTGKVYKTVTTDAIAYTYVALVNAENKSIIYATTETDDTGRYRFNGIPSTGGQNTYRLIARNSTFADGDSGAFSLGNGKVFVDVKLGDPIVITATPKPILANGSISGRVTEAGTGTAMADVTVSMVSANSLDTVYFTTLTDKNGIYRFENLDDFSTNYQIVANAVGYKDDYTPIFQVDPGKNINMNIVMDVKPMEITPFATATPRVDTAQPTSEGSSGLPIPGFEVPLALMAAVIGIAVAGKLRN